jgi:hypothetical protein
MTLLLWSAPSKRNELPTKQHLQARRYASNSNIQTSHDDDSFVMTLTFDLASARSPQEGLAVNHAANEGHDTATPCSADETTA